MRTSVITALALASVALPSLAAAQDTPVPTPAAARAAPALAAGAKVYGPQGDEVGVIQDVSGDAVIVDTGASKATLARSSFGAGAKGPVIGMNKAQLEAAVQQAAAQTQAARDAAVTPGAEVKSSDGVVIGKVAKVDGDSVVIDRPSGPVTLTRAQLASRADGLTVAATAAAFDAAARAATAPTATAKAPR